MNGNTPSIEPARHLELRDARVTILGYGSTARDHALGLRSRGNEVTIGLRLGGLSWIRARRDGFDARAPTLLVADADVVVVLVPDDEQATVYYHAIEPLLAPGALLVFGRGLALGTGVFEPRAHDVVLVTGELGSAAESGWSATHAAAVCRVAVHHDATGHALERAIAYARAVFGMNASIGTMTTSAEVEVELAALEARAGSRDALLDSVERRAARVRDTHAPEEVKVAFYEALRELIERRAPHSHAAKRGSGPVLFWSGPGGRA